MGPSPGETCPFESELDEEKSPEGILGGLLRITSVLTPLSRPDQWTSVNKWAMAAGQEGTHSYDCQEGAGRIKSDPSWCDTAGVLRKAQNQDERVQRERTRSRRVGCSDLRLGSHSHSLS